MVRRDVICRTLAWLGAPLVSMSCVTATGPDPFASIPTEVRQVNVGNRNRQYIVVSPPKDDTATRPLVLMFHGSGGTAFQFLSASNFFQRDELPNALIVSLEAVQEYGGRWAVHPDDLSLLDDVEYTRAVVADVAGAFKVDAKRIYAIGYSRGGDFIYQLACRAPDIIRAAVAVGSTMMHTTEGWCAESKGAPLHPALMMILGSVDPLMPWTVGDTRRKGAEETVDFWTERYRCQTEPTEGVMSAGAPFKVILRSYAPCGTEDFRLIRIEPLGHAWPAVAFDVEGTILAYFGTQSAR